MVCRTAMHQTYIAIFGKMNIHESQLFLGEQKGTRLLTHTHITTVYYNVANPIQNLPFKDDIYNPCIALLGLPHGSVSKPCTPVVHIKIAGLKWMFIPLKMVFL